MPPTLSAGLNRAAEKKLRERLQHILPRVSKGILEELLESVLKSDAAPSDSLAERLLSEKCTPNEIHLALIYCRNALLMMQLQPHKKVDFKRVRKVLAHFDRMSAFLMKAVEKQHEQAWKSLQTELLNEGHAHLLSRAISYWSQEREITIYNYYKEMPVNVLVKLLHVSENDFTIVKSNELVALISASEDGKSAYTRMPNSELSIRLTIEEVTGKTVHWRYGEFQPISREKRRDVRVQSSTPVHIRLKSPEHKKWDGSVMDISASGLGISCQCETPFQVGDVLVFSMLLHGHRFAGKGAVCWAHGAGGHYQAGLALEHDMDGQMRLSNEVARRQKNLFGELKIKGIPDGLMPG
ncbi:MAG: PilZ domain-containing protein [Mariprofundaceae bacterium]